MYALTATSYRAIADASDVKVGETFAATLPQSLLDSMAATQAQRDANKATLVGRADTALASNKTYLAIASPTNAQVAAQVKALTQQNNAVIRLLLGRLEATD